MSIYKYYYFIIYIIYIILLYKYYYIHTLYIIFNLKVFYLLYKETCRLFMPLKIISTSPYNTVGQANHIDFKK